MRLACLACSIVFRYSVNNVYKSYVYKSCCQFSKQGPGLYFRLYISSVISVSNDTGKGDGLGWGEERRGKVWAWNLEGLSGVYCGK